jgi:hypothetical protein
MVGRETRKEGRRARKCLRGDCLEQSEEVLPLRVPLAAELAARDRLVGHQATGVDQGDAENAGDDLSGEEIREILHAKRKWTRERLSDRLEAGLELSCGPLRNTRPAFV